MTSILSITGSDNAGWSGLQLDLRIVAEMGGHALTAATCFVIQNGKEIKDIISCGNDIIREQVESVISDFHPKAVKVGLVRSADDVRTIAKEIVACRKVVVAPGVMASNGTQLIDDDTIEAIKRHLVPMADLLILRQAEAEKVLGMSISTDEDMLHAAQQFIDMGAEYVMLRGGKIVEGRITALFAGKESHQFFSSYNIDGWQQHGVGGALSAAITLRMGMGDGVHDAIRNAHEYIHSRIVYSVNQDSRKLRPADIYNEFMNLLTDNYASAHDVTFYADRLNITTRYLSQITNNTVSKTPKMIIADYLMHQARQLLENSRLSVKEIADELGFSTTAMFCKFFKQQQQTTPSEYRLSVGMLS